MRPTVCDHSSQSSIDDLTHATAIGARWDDGRAANDAIMVAASWLELRKVSFDNELKAQRPPSLPARHGVTPATSPV
jgi:hypothetical protein